MIKETVKKFRGFAERNTQIATLAAVGFMALAATAIYFQLREATPPEPTATTDAYYLDLTNGNLFSAPIAELPPVKTPGSKADAPPRAAQAYVFACQSCDNPADRFVGYVEIYKDEARARLMESVDAMVAQKVLAQAQAIEHVRLSNEADPEIMANHLIATPRPHEPGKAMFVVATSTEGEAVIAAVAQHCGEGAPPPIACQPPMNKQ